MATSSRTRFFFPAIAIALVFAVLAGSRLISTGSDANEHGESSANSQAEKPYANLTLATTDAASKIVVESEHRYTTAPTHVVVADLHDYMCAGNACAAGPTGDPRVADSIEEAVWMRERAFPTQQQRELARVLDADALLQQAEAERSAALRILGLEKRISGTDDPAVIEQAATELRLRARQRRELYALYAEFEANRKLAEIAVRNHRSATEALLAAMKAARLAVMLGDRKAASLYQLLPRDLVTAGRWAMVNESLQLYLNRGTGHSGMLSMQLYAFRPSLDERPQPVAGQVTPVGPGG